MSNVFEILKRMGGVVEENGVTYVTHPNPPANDDSQKIATTAWVRDITDSLEASVNGGMFPTVSKAVLSGNALKYPNGGTWWGISLSDASSHINEAKAGGSVIHYNADSSHISGYFFIKIS